MKKYHFKTVFIFIVYVFLAIPYLLHPSQDLFDPVNHDEAAIHLNAKDILLFGPSAIKDDRLTYINFPLNFLIGLISFSIFGISLFSLRVPYILLNIIGNILFFHFIRRSRGILIAALIASAFALYAPRLIIGKAAMVESLTLPLVLMLIWSFSFISHKPKIYFWIGILGTLIVWTKLDNIFVPLFLTGFVSFESYNFWRKGNLTQTKHILKFYLLGTGTVIIIWLGFYLLVGWKKAWFCILYALRPNLNIAKFTNGFSFSPFSIQLFLRNLIFFYRTYSGFLIATAICLILFLLLILYSKKERKSPLSLAIYLLLFLLIGKISVSTIYSPRRFALCYPLLFLVMASIFGFLLNYLSCEKLRSKILISLKKSLFFLSFLILIYVCYKPNMLRISLYVMSSPQYNFLREAQLCSSLLDRRYKAIFLDGRFAYIALQLPNKFIDIPPDLNEKDFYQMETNPTLTRKRIYEDRDIVYVFFCPDNTIIGNMVENEFGGKLLAYNVTGYGLLYSLPQRIKPDDKGK